MKTNKMKKNTESRKLLLGMAAVILSLVLSAACSKADKPPAVSPLDGVWFYDHSGTEEHLGSFDYTDIWIISDGRYYNYSERISSQAMHWQLGSRGAIIIKDREITLRPNEAIFQGGDWEPAKKDDTRITANYTYVLNGDELSLEDKDNGGSVELRKSPWRYTGSMYGSQDLSIRLTIAAFDASGEVHNAYYQYYNERRREYGDPIMLNGRLQEGTLTLYEMEPKDPAIKRASLIFSDYSIFSNPIEGVWQDLRKGRAANKYDLDLYLGESIQ